MNLRPMGVTQTKQNPWVLDIASQGVAIADTAINGSNKPGTVSTNFVDDSTREPLSMHTPGVPIKSTKNKLLSEQNYKNVTGNCSVKINCFDRKRQSIRELQQSSQTSESVCTQQQSNFGQGLLSKQQKKKKGNSTFNDSADQTPASSSNDDSDKSNSENQTQPNQRTTSVYRPNQKIGLNNLLGASHSKKSNMNYQQGVEGQDLQSQKQISNTHNDNFGSDQQININIGGKLLKAVQDKPQENQQQLSEERQTKKYQIDPITGLNLNQYLMKKGYNRMIKLLKRLGEQRKQNDTVNQTIKDVAIGCRLDLSEQGLDDLVSQIRRLVARRVKKKRELERGIQGYIGNDCCKVALKSQLFLSSTAKQKHNCKKDQFDKEFQVAAIQLANNHECSHQNGEEDIEKECVSLYKKLIVFRSRLHHQLKQEMSKDSLVRGIMEHIREDSQVDKQHIQLFQNEENIIRLLNNPFMEIIESDEVAQIEQAIQDQASPQKYKNQQKVQTLGLQGPLIYETKNQQTVSISAKQTIQEVQAKIKQQREEQFLLEEQQAEAELADDPELSDDDEDVKAARALEERRKLARKLLLAGSKPKGATIRQTKTFFDIHELIAENIERDELIASTDPESDKSKAITKKLAQQMVQNSQMLFRLALIEQIQDNEIKDSLREGYTYHKILHEKMNEDDLSNLKHRLGGLDEAFSSMKNEYIDASEIHWKKMKEMDKLIKPIQVPKQSQNNYTWSKVAQNASKIFEKKGLSLQSNDAQSQLSNDLDDHVNSNGGNNGSYYQNLLNNLDATDKFYHKAKHEIAGNNQPPTQESEFYVNCQQNRLLAYPIFKCVKNNTMNFHGQPLSVGYCKAFGYFIKNNVESQDHLLSVHFDDCRMKDEGFAEIIDAIMNSKSFYPSIQSIKYSNNEIGALSISKLNDLMQLDHKVQGFEQQVYCLKELVLSNVTFKKLQDLRMLMQTLAGPPGKNLRKLKLHQINLNQGDCLTQQEMLSNICQFVETSTNLRSLSLSQCNLGAKSLFRDDTDKFVLKTSFIKLFDSLITNKSNLECLDLSGNPISSKIPNHAETVDIIVQKISQLIEEKPSLQSLNLSGMMLTSSIIKIVPFLQNNKTLCFLNLSSNGLLPYDQDYIFKEMEIKSAISDADVIKSIDLLLQTDSCFRNSLAQFKNHHLKDEFIIQMCQSKSQQKQVKMSTPIHPNLIDSNNANGECAADGELGSGQFGQIDQQCHTMQEMQLLKQQDDNKREEQELYANMVNSAIMKRVKENNSLARKINFEAEIGGEKIQMSTLLGDTIALDEVVLHREARNPEFIFNTLHSSVKRAGIDTQSLESYDFKAPHSWNYLPEVLNKQDNREINYSAWQEAEYAQYVSICVDIQNIQNHFNQVYDSHTIRILKRYYGLHKLKKRWGKLPQTSQVKNGLLVFGTINDWKAYQMIKLYKMTTAMVAQTEKEQQALAIDVFDEVNNNLKQTFKTIQSTIWYFYQCLLRNENAQIVGMNDQQYQGLKTEEKNEMIQNRCFTYSVLVRKPGKHSIFIYDIAKDIFYFKSIVVEMPLPWTFICGKFSPLLNDEQAGYQNNDNLIMSPHNHNAIQKLDYSKSTSGKNLLVPDQKSTKQMLVQLSFLNDISPSYLHITSYFKKDKELEAALVALYKRYEKVVNLFQHLRLSDTTSYPFISDQILLKFVEDQKLMILSKPASKNSQVEKSDQQIEEQRQPKDPEATEPKKLKIQQVELPTELQPFQSPNRIKFIHFIFWAWKQYSGNKYWPNKFDTFLDEQILKVKDTPPIQLIELSESAVELSNGANYPQVVELPDMWSTKMEMANDGDLQDLIKANSTQLLNFLYTCSHIQDFYVGFDVVIARQIVIAGELDALKPPEPSRTADSKKKKGKKKAAAEAKKDGKKGAAAAEEEKPKKPLVETLPIEEDVLIKLFYQSLGFALSEQRGGEGDRMHLHIKTLDELTEFLYRLSQHIYSADTYPDIKKVPKTTQQLFEASSVQKMIKVMTVLFKAAQMKVQVLQEGEY